ncbi:hypothetical protein GCM10025776_22090 [Corallincola platygyrae]
MQQFVSECPRCEGPIEVNTKTDSKWLNKKGIEFVWYSQQAENYASKRGLDAGKLKIEIQSGLRQGYNENGTWFVRYQLATRKRGRSLPMMAASVATVATLLGGVMYGTAYTATSYDSVKDKMMMLCKAEVEQYAEPGEITYTHAQATQPTKRLWQVSYNLEFNTREEKGAKKVATCVLEDGKLSEVKLVALNN